MRNLTRKQRGFLKYYLKGYNATEAVMMVYNTSNRNSAKVIGSKLLTSANVKHALEQGLASQGVSINQLAQSLMELACAKVEKVSGDTKLKASIEILKLLGVYPSSNIPSTNIHISSYIKNMNFEEAKAELEALNRSR